MSSSLISVFRGMEDKLDLLAEYEKEIESKYRALEEENLLLKRELKAKGEEIEVLKRDNDYLKISHRLAESPDTLIETRRMIARLIRNIDKCISMLNEEELR